MIRVIGTSDIKDHVVAKRITENEINAGNVAVSVLADKLGVKSYLEVDDIVRMYGVANACYAFCLSYAGSDPTTGMGNDDVYVAKSKLYRSEIDRLEAVITAKNFGSDEGRARVGVPLYRA